GFALLWLVTLAWGLGRRGQAERSRTVRGVPRASPGTTVLPPGGGSAAGLRRALEGGDLSEIVDALHALAPEATGGSVAALRDQLAGGAARDALDALEAARWGEADPAAARAAARAAFARGPAWNGSGSGRTRAAPLVPPLYPDRKSTRLNSSH